MTTSVWYLLLNAMIVIHYDICDKLSDCICLFIVWNLPCLGRKKDGMSIVVWLLDCFVWWKLNWISLKKYPC